MYVAGEGRKKRDPSRRKKRGRESFVVAGSADLNLVRRSIWLRSGRPRHPCQPILASEVHGAAGWVCPSFFPSFFSRLLLFFFFSGLDFSDRLALTQMISCRAEGELCLTNSKTTTTTNKASMLVSLLPGSPGVERVRICVSVQSVSRCPRGQTPQETHRAHRQTFACARVPSGSKKNVRSVRVIPLAAPSRLLSTVGLPS